MAIQLKQLTVRNLYGFLDITIKFKPSVNLLVGINGSGKTSILNLINWLLRPSMPQLCVTKFDQVRLAFSLEGNHHEVICDQSEKELIYKLTGRRKFTPLKVSLHTSAADASKDAELRERLLGQYRGLAPTKEEKMTWNYLNDVIPSPVVIGLDRRLFASEGDRVVYEDRMIGRALIREETSSQQNPLDRAKKFANTQYRKHRNEIIALNERLKSKIMLSSFSSTFSLSDLSKRRASKVTADQVEQLESKVKSYIQGNVGTPNYKMNQRIPSESRELAKVTMYFRSLKQLLKKAKHESKGSEIDILLMVNYSQFEKIRELIREFEVFEDTSRKSYADIAEYLLTLNSFLFDSAKHLLYKPDTAELTYNQLDSKGNIISHYLDLETLSSGEKQIVTLLTYLKFGQQVGRLYLIDEPELSLHPKWQSEFLNSVMKLTPEDTQLILATHSAEIVGEFEDRCTILLPYSK